MGMPTPKIVDYCDLIDDVELLEEYTAQPLLIRLEAPAESLSLERALLTLGYEDAVAADVSVIDPDAVKVLPTRLGEYRYPSQFYYGFSRLLQRFQIVYQKSTTAQWLAEPEQTAFLFDKQATTELYRAQGILVADTLPVCHSLDEILERMEEREWPEVYIKHRYGSTACGMMMLRWHRQRMFAVTTMSRRRGRWYNSLRLEHHAHPERVKPVIDYLLKEGVQIEQAIPKMQIDGIPFDCRVVMIAGEVAFVVLRKSNKPFSNLHLGGERGTYRELQRVVDGHVLEHAWECCRKVARLHRQFVIGIDLLFHRNGQQFVVLESNAFGDLLPNLTRQNRTVYQWEISALQAGWGAGIIIH